MMTRTIAMATALALSGIALAPAVSAQDTTSASVTYSDLDLATDEGREELASRIDRAAKQVCGLNETDLGTRIRSREARECYRETTESFERQLAGAMGETQRGG